MKRISKSIKSVFRHIGSFFDKWLITPITKVFLKIADVFKDNAKSVDRIAGRKSTLIIVSLILAFGVFVIIDQESSVMIDQYAEVLYDEPVNAVYNEELYVVEGLPKTVDITLIGQRRHIFLAKQSPSKGVTVDLTGLKPGNHKVTLEYSQRLKSLDYRLDPSEVTENETKVRFGNSYKFNPETGYYTICNRPTPESPDSECVTSNLEYYNPEEVNYNDGNIFLSRDLIIDIEKVVKKIMPEIIITHFYDIMGVDHQDHASVSKATINVASRCSFVNKILLCEPLMTLRSSFTPNVFVDITTHFEEKIEALQKHNSQHGRFYLERIYQENKASFYAGSASYDDLKAAKKYEAFQLIFEKF